MIRRSLANAIDSVGAQLLLICACSRAQVIVPVHSDFRLVASMTSSGGEMWIGSEKGVFRVNEATNQVFFANGNAGVVISKLVVSDKEIFVGAFTNGAFRINPKTNEAVRIEGNYANAISTVVKADGVIWFGGTNCAFRIPYGNNTALPLIGKPGRVDFIAFEDGDIGVGGTNGTFRVDRRSNRLVSVGNTGYALSTFSYKGEVWLGSELRTEGWEWKRGKHKALSTLPHPRRRRRLSEFKDNFATLTLSWHKTSGRPVPLRNSYDNALASSASLRHFQQTNRVGVLLKLF